MTRMTRGVGTTGSQLYEPAEGLDGNSDICPSDVHGLPPTARVKHRWQLAGAGLPMQGHEVSENRHLIQKSLDGVNLG